MRRIVTSDEFPEEMLRILSAQVETLVTSAEHQYWTHKRSTVVYQRIQGHEVIIKRFNAPTLKAIVKRRLGPSPALKAYRNAMKLGNIGLRTPRPIASLDTRGPASYLITEYLHGEGTDAFFADTGRSEACKQRVAERIRAAVEHLHRAGYVHGDLKARNLLIKEGQPYFIDLDSLHTPWLPMRRRRAISADYARLQASLPELRIYWPQAHG